MTRRDWITDAGILVVGLAAAVLTFTTLRDLGEAVGVEGWLAWLVPVTVDAAGIVATRVWLRRSAADEAVAFARTLAWVCIVASIVGNAGQHYMAAEGVDPAWWVIVLVSAVPPAMLGAVVHLGHLTRRTGPPDQQTGPDRTVVEEPGPLELEDGPGEEWADPWDRWADDVPADTDQQTVPARTEADRGLTSNGPADRDEDDELVPAVRAWADRQTGPPSRNAVMREFNVGTGRAARLLEAVR